MFHLKSQWLKDEWRYRRYAQPVFAGTPSLIRRRSDRENIHSLAKHRLPFQQQRREQKAAAAGPAQLTPAGAGVPRICIQCIDLRVTHLGRRNCSPG